MQKAARPGNLGSMTDKLNSVCKNRREHEIQALWSTVTDLMYQRMRL